MPNINVIERVGKHFKDSMKKSGIGFNKHNILIYFQEESMLTCGAKPMLADVKLARSFSVYV